MFVFYALVSTETGKAIDLFLDREAADAMLANCLTDEPDSAGVLSIERI